MNVACHKTNLLKELVPTLWKNNPKTYSVFFPDFKSSFLKFFNIAMPVNSNMKALKTK